MTGNPAVCAALGLVVVLALAGVPPAFPTATGAAERAAHTTAETGTVLAFTESADRLTVEVCRANVLRVTYQPRGLPAPHTLAVDDAPCAAVAATVTREARGVAIRTAQMDARIETHPLRLSLYSAAGHLLLSQPHAAGTGAYAVHFLHATGDQFYGVSGDFGVPDITANRGGEVHAGSEGAAGAPLVWSTAGYGMLIDYDGGEFDITSAALDFNLKTFFPDTSRYHKPFAPSGLTYYLMSGTPKDIMRGIAQVSGPAPMFPKSALGFANSQWGSNEAELKSIVATYRAKHEPIDSFIMDFDWKDWGADNYGEFRWNPKTYPDGDSGALKRYMDARGLKLLGIMKPRIRIDSVEGRYATAHNCWYPKDPPNVDYQSGEEMRNLNFYNAACRTWFWSHIQRAFDTGISGWWNDEQDFGDIDTPVFEGLNMQRALYEGQRAHASQRVWSLNRNFFLGAQRYAYGLWSGDIDTGFESMAQQAPNMLSSALIGEAQWSMDIGGFHGDPTPENYARWMQFGAFVPIYRVHGEFQKKRQPWRYGAHAEAIAKSALDLRYSLIPYMYSYERRAHDTGLGLVEPLLVAYPQDTRVQNYADAWMFGDYLLVAPVLAQGQSVKPVYLPTGSWIDYFRGTRYAGGQTIAYHVNASTWSDIPLFIKLGAIIPTQPVMDYIGERPVTTIAVDVFPDTARTAFNYYDDDGITYNYERGGYFSQQITTQQRGNGVQLSLGPRHGSYTPALRTYLCQVHTRKAATGVSDNGVMLRRYSNRAALQRAGGEGWSTGTDRYGAVTYIIATSGSAHDLLINAPPA